MLESDLAGLDPPVGHVEAGAAQHDVEVQAVNADRRVVLDAQVDVFLDSEAEVAGGGEVVAAQLVLAHLQAALQDLLGLGATDRAVDGDLLVTTDAERAHGVACLRVDGLLASQLLQHLEDNGMAKQIATIRIIRHWGYCHIKSTLGSGFVFYSCSL